MNDNKKRLLKPIRVLIADDHMVIRAGIKALLEQDKTIQVVAEAKNGTEALALAKTTHPDVITLDIDMPDGHAVDVVRKFKRLFPKIKIIIVSAFSAGFYPSYFSRSTIHGYVTKERSPAELRDAIYSAYDDKTYFSSDIVQQLACEQLQVQEHSKFKNLTERELQIVVQILKTSNSQQNADRKQASDKTISSYRSKILKKLGLESEVELLHLAVKDGLLFEY